MEMRYRLRSQWILVVTALMLFPALHAQISSITEGVPFLSHSNPRQWYERIQNESPVWLVAFEAEFHCPRGGPEFLYDALFNYGADSEIPSGGSIKIPVGDPSKCSGGVEAAIFSNGHADGDPEILQQMYDRRRGALKALSDSIPLVNALSKAKVPRQYVLGKLNAMLHSSASSYFGMGYASVCTSLEAALTHRADIRVPSDYTAQRQPTIPAFMRKNRVTWEVAQATILGRKLQEWRVALTGKTGTAVK